MNRELLDKLNEKKDELASQLKELEKEKKDLITKVNNGEKLSFKENKRNQELTELISSIKANLSKFNVLNNYRTIQEGFENLIKNSGTISTDEATTVSKAIKDAYKKLNAEEKKKLMDSTKLNASTLKNITKLKDGIEKNIDALKSSIKIMEEKSINTDSLNEQLHEQETLLESINKYENSLVSETELDNDIIIILTNTALSEDDKRKLVNEKYLDRLSEKEKDVAEQLQRDLELTNIKTSKVAGEDSDTKTATTSKSESKSVRNAIIGTCLGAAIFCVLAHFIAKSMEDDISTTKGGTEPQDPQSSHSVEAKTSNPTVEKLVAYGFSNEFAELINNNYSEKDINRILAMPSDKTDTMDKIANIINKINKLVKKGYDERHSILFVKNFSDETIDSMLNMPYNEIFNSYANAKDFNIDYLEDYELYRNLFTITNTKVVDYVNRSYKIQETNFYDDASIDDIIKVVMSIDNKDLFKTENATQTQSINTAFNRIVDNYLFGTTTEDDINKLDAIKYFAREDSDLGKFLSGFGSLSQDIVKNPQDINVRDNMIQYISIFATSLNGFTNEPSTLTDNEAFNENAQVNDYYDWYIAYNSFVGPLGDILMYPKELESVDLFYAEEIYHDTNLYEVNEDESLEDALSRQQETRKELLEKFGYGKYLDSIYKLYKVYDLRELMHTALKDPQFENICGQSRNLGGN